MKGFEGFRVHWPVRFSAQPPAARDLVTNYVIGNLQVILLKAFLGIRLFVLGSHSLKLVNLAFTATAPPKRQRKP